MAAQPLNADALSTAGDGLLAERASDGDTAAFEVLARRYAPAMRGYARRITGSLADADDVVQESLLQAWTRLADLSEPNAVRAWLMRITANCSINVVRRRKSTTTIDAVADPPDPAPTPEAAALTATGMTALSVALARLPEEQRNCWVLKEMGDQSYEEIGRTLSISPDSVRGRLSRARATLLKDMEAWQ